MAPAMAPRPLSVVTLPPNHSTLQWHIMMAPNNGTASTPPKLVVTLPPNHGTLQWHPTMASSNGTLVPRPIRQSGSSPSPPIGSKNPIAIAIWGTKRLDPNFKLVRSRAKWRDVHVKRDSIHQFTINPRWIPSPKQPPLTRNLPRRWFTQVWGFA